MIMRNPKAKILIVDDDPAFCKIESKRLKEQGFIVETATDPKKAIEIIETETFDLIISDLKMEELSGIDVLKKVKNISPSTEVILLTAFSSVETAVEAIKSGAYDYIAKSSPYQELVFKISRALEKKDYVNEIDRLKDSLKERYSLRNIIGKNEKMQEVYRLIETVRDTDISVLIRGETGTGKELAAKAIHFNSFRREKPFVIVNCAAISETLVESELFGHVKGAFTGAIKDKPGKLELAAGGTVFLDEIGDLSINLQAKLLRVLQDKKFERVGGTQLLSTDARIISATNRNLEELIKENRFREDLFYRINVVSIDIPPLRERIDDIKLLLDYFLVISNREFNKKIEGFSDGAMKLLLTYNWPGNVRELENLIKKMVLTVKGAEISDKDVKNNLKGAVSEMLLKKEFFTKLPWKEMMNKTEKEYFESLLRQFKGKLTMVCQKANINRRMLHRKMNIFNLRREDYLGRGKDE